MQPLQTIESILTTLNTQDFKSVEVLIKKQIEQNRKSFQQAIKDGDITQIENFLDKVSFDEEFLISVRRNVVPALSSMDYFATKSIEEKVFTTDYETLNTFYTLFHDVLDLGEEKTFSNRVKKEKLEFNLGDLLFAGLFYRLTSHFQFSEDANYPQYLFLKKFLDKEPAFFKKALYNFCEYTLHKISYQDNSLLIQDLLKLGYKDKLFQQAKTLENYSYLKNIVPIKNIYNDEFMLSGLSSYHFAMVNECFLVGIPFFNTDTTLSSEKKAQYKNVFSSVFASKDSLDIQNFIIDNIPDISVGNHIIVKTIFHKLEDKFETDIERNQQRVVLLNNVMNRYSQLSQDTLLSLKSIIDKRENSESKTLFEKFINYQLLNKKYPDNYHKENKNKI